MSTSKLCFALLAIVCCASRSAGAPVKWSQTLGGNGHSYDLVIQTATWPQAKAAAEAMTFEGVHGYLATITSQAESDFMAANLPLNSYWIGGYQDLLASDYSEPDGGWRWVTGEPFVFTNWKAGEPNNDGGDERYIETFTSPAWSWNDLPPNFEHGAFYIEYPTPEPSSMVLAAVGIAGLLLLVRSRRVTKGSI